MTIQAKMKATLERAGIPYKEVECYGSQIVITAWSREAANRWGALIQEFAKLRGIVEALDYNEENTGTVPSTHRVWRVFGMVK